MPEIRPPMAAEILLLGRALLPLPQRSRRKRAELILAETFEAAAYFTASGKVHPSFGDGSLMARILPLRPVAEPFADNADFLQALSVAVGAMRRYRRTASPPSQL